LLLSGLIVSDPCDEQFRFDEKLARRLSDAPEEKKTRGRKNQQSTQPLDESDDCELTEECIYENDFYDSSDDCDFDVLDTLCDADLKDFPEFGNISLHNSAFVRLVGKDGKDRIVKKSSVVWFLENSRRKLSSDRKLRVMQTATFKDRQRRVIKAVEKRTVRVGDWCIFKSEENNLNFLIGRVISLAVMDGKKNEGSKFVWEWKSSDKTANNIGALCVWYYFERVNSKITGKLEETQMNSIGFYPCHNYICSCPPPKFSISGDVNSLSLNPRIVKQIDDFTMSRNKKK